MNKEKTLLTVDGNEACAHVAYAFSEVATIYPITPSSPMAGKVDEWSGAGRKNLFGQPLKVVEMQSEAGAVGAMHGVLEAGSLATSFTSAQGLMLMIPVMHRISGSHLPAVLHVATRTVGAHGMSIFCDHSDVMNCRQTGFAMLSSGSVQETMDLAGVAHLAAVKAKVPFMHFFDGFRTSHEIQKIEAIDYEDLAKLVDWDAIQRFRDHSLNPDHPTLRNTNNNPDIFFQNREASNLFYDAVPQIVEDYLAEITKITGREYHLFNYYGAPDAENVIVAIGSVSGPAKECVEYLNARGEKVGYLQVHLYRPFAVDFFLDALPKTVKKITVLDRCREFGAVGQPLFEDVSAIFANKENAPKLYSGIYGVGSKETDTAVIKAVYDNMAADAPKSPFTVGITDDVSHLSIPVGPVVPVGEGKITACKFWGLGGDGTVGANKNSIHIIGDNTDKYCQAYFEYDAKKSLGLTRSHLRFGDVPIESAYLVTYADFIACHCQAYLHMYDNMAKELKPGGTFLLNCNFDPETIEEHLPNAFKKALAEKNAQFYIIDANKIAQSLGLGNKMSMVLQASFFKLANIIPIDEAVAHMKAAVEKSFRKKGAEVVAKNQAAVDAGLDGLVKIEVKESWKDLPVVPADVDSSLPEFVRDVMIPMNQLKGDEMPVSAFLKYYDGVMPTDTSKYEKRGIAPAVPVWDPTVCAQCNRCSLVCSHAVIRPYLLTDEEAANAPADIKLADAKGKEAAGYKYSLQISALDCTGCGACVANCPLTGKALKMETVGTEVSNPESWDYALTLSDKGVFDKYTAKGSQFQQPLLEFSAACGGCPETIYGKLITQLFGDNCYWVNATGCSQSWAASTPSYPYAKNKAGHGPAWANSLFEDNAEYGLGMLLASKIRRERLAKAAAALKEAAPQLKAPVEAWEAAFDEYDESRVAANALVEALEAADLDGDAAKYPKELLDGKDQLARKSVWLFGGDGWAYDIGFGGLDHVIASGEDINVFILDNELYANTGGQSSKATPLGASAQFQATGKKTPKKDLGRMMMTYGNCYVASVAMGADQNQLMKALKEAAEFKGPSVIVAYSPCINHGIKGGMSNAQNEMKRAVEAGYWTLYRYDPRKADHKLSLDSKEPTADYQEYLRGETRYSGLDITYPENAEKLFAQAAELAKDRYNTFARLAAE